MSKATEQRRTRFLKALAATGMTQSRWATDNGITKAHLSLVINGHRESITLTTKIDAFIREHLNSKAALAS